MKRRDDVQPSDLMLAIAKHCETTGQPALTNEELANAADNLLAYFGLLIQADKKVMQNHAAQTV